MNRNTIVFVVLFAICWILIGLFRLPSWFLYICILLIGLFLIIRAQSKNNKALKKMMPIPENGYEKAKRELRDFESKIDHTIFAMVDSFFIDGIPKVLARIYLDSSMTSFLSIYHFQTTMSYEFSSAFENGFTLSTSSNINSGLIPRPPKMFLCVFDGADISNLYREHIESIGYLTQSGLKPKIFGKEDYRKNSEQAEKALSEFRKSKPFFSLRTIYWLLTKRGKIHCQSISEQHRKGIATGF